MPKLDETLDALEASATGKGKAIKSAAAFVAAVGVLLGSAMTVDERYAHADTLAAESVKQQQQVTELNSSILDDKIFELEIRKANSPKTFTATDQLMLDRYKAKQDRLALLQRQQSRELSRVSNAAANSEATK